MRVFPVFDSYGGNKIKRSVNVSITMIKSSHLVIECAGRLVLLETLETEEDKKKTKITTNIINYRGNRSISTEIGIVNCYNH